MGVLQGAPFWDPVPFSWPLMLLMLAACLLLTIGFLVWTALQSDAPDPRGSHTGSSDPRGSHTGGSDARGSDAGTPGSDPGRLLDRAVARDRARARTVQRRLDADAGRADTSEPELR